MTPSKFVSTISNIDRPSSPRWKVAPKASIHAARNSIVQCGAPLAELKPAPVNEKSWLSHNHSDRPREISIVTSAIQRGAACE